MVLDTLKEFDSDVADVFYDNDIKLKEFEIEYIESMLEKKFDGLVHAFPRQIIDSDDPKIFNLKNTFKQSMAHILAVRKKTAEELAETVLSTVEDVYRKLKVSDSYKIFSGLKKSHYLKELKGGNNPLYEVNGVKIQMDRYGYYTGLSLISGEISGIPICLEKFREDIKEEYNPELSLLMETIYDKVFSDWL